MDEAGPYTTTPYPGSSWQVELHPKRYPHEYPRDGTAKMLTLFHPATGHVRVKGVTSTTNVILHGWLKQELTDILAQLPEPSPVLEGTAWENWGVIGGSQATQGKPDLPPLRMLLIMDNLAGHKTPEFVVWLFRHGLLPLYTPLAAVG